MEKKKINLGNTAAGAGKAAAGFFSKAKGAVVNAVDQNGDGKLGLDDVSIVTNTVRAAVKDSSNRWNEKQEQKRREKELAALRPLFEEDVDNPDFSLPKLIRIAEMDDNHRESDGKRFNWLYLFWKRVDVTTIYPKKIGFLICGFTLIWIAKYTMSILQIGISIFR